jgi:hypothetical protein
VGCEFLYLDLLDVCQAAFTITYNISNYITRTSNFFWFLIRPKLAQTTPVDLPWWTPLVNSFCRILWSTAMTRLLLQTPIPKLLSQPVVADCPWWTHIPDSFWWTAITSLLWRTSLADCCDKQPFTAFIILAINCWSIRCHDTCVLTDRY